MSVFKPLGPTDVTLSQRQVNKEWEITSGSFNNLGLSTRVFQKPSEDTLLTLDTPSGSLFHSIKHLYYSNFLNDDNEISGSFENYIQTSLFEGTRELQTGSFGQLVSVPRQVFGEFIVPGTVEIRDDSLFKFVEEFENKSGTFEVTHNLNNRFPFYVIYETSNNSLHEEVIPQEFKIIDENTVEITFPEAVTGKVVIFVMKKVFLRDDGNGKILKIIEDDLNNQQITGKEEVGDIIYTHGNILLQEGILQPKIERFPFDSQTDFIFTHTLETLNPVIIVYNDQDEHIIPKEIIKKSQDTIRFIFPQPVSGTVVVGRPSLSDLKVEPFTAPSVTTFLQISSHTIAHNFDTKDLIVQVFKTDGGKKEMVIPKTIDTSNPNKLTVEVTNPGEFEVAIYNGTVIGNPLNIPTSNGKVELTNSLTIKTLRTTGKVSSEEFNFSSNPSAVEQQEDKVEGAISQSGGKVKDVTPYMTTIGLYNDSHELIAVAKVPRPVPISSDIDTTFEISLDL